MTTLNVGLIVIVSRAFITQLENVVYFESLFLEYREEINIFSTVPTAIYSYYIGAS